MDEFLTAAAAKGVSGSVLVVHRDTVILHRGYGLASRDSGRPIAPDDPFFVGSVAKQFTATAILRLAADRQLAITDSVGTFFPAATPPVRAVTVGQLLAHSSGLPYLPTHGLFGQGTRDSVMREMLGEPIAFPPGSRYDYSSVGYVLLAGIIERASRMSYERYLETKLFQPAGLTSTGFIGDTARWGGAAVESYSDLQAEGRLGSVPAFPRAVGAGSVVTTVVDMHRWYTALVSGKVLPDSFAAELFKPRLAIRPGTSGGYAWTIVSLPTGTLRLIAGDIGGYNAEMRHYVDERLMIFFASNHRVNGRGDRETVMNALARISRGETVPPPVGER